MDDNWRERAEYEGLRSEILASLRQQFDVAVALVAASAALFTYGFSSRNGVAFICPYILLFFVVEHARTMLSFNLEAAAYIRVFHEADDTAGWESRMARLRQAVRGAPSIGVRKRLLRAARAARGIGAYCDLYCLLAAASSVASFFYLPGWHRFVWPSLLLIVWTLFNIRAYSLFTHRYATGDIERVKMWRSIRDCEIRDASAKLDPTPR